MRTLFPSLIGLTALPLLLAGCPGDDSGDDGPGTSTAGSSGGSTDGGSDEDTTDDPSSTGNGSGSDGPGTTTGDPDGSTTDDPDTTGDAGSESSSGGGAALPLQLNLMGYDPHVGQDIHIKIFDDADAELGSLDSTVDMANQGYTIDMVAQEGSSYTVRWWVDLMDNDTCDPQPVDHMWEMTGQVADATGVTIDHGHDATWTDVCPFW